MANKDLPLLDEGLAPKATIADHSSGSDNWDYSLTDRFLNRRTVQVLNPFKDEQANFLGRGDKFDCKF